MFVTGPQSLAVGRLRLLINFLPQVNVCHYLSYLSHFRNCLHCPSLSKGSTDGETSPTH